MSIKKLHDSHGILISELVEYLQKEFLDSGNDGLVWLDTCVLRHVEPFGGGAWFACDTNPCIEIYRESESRARYLDAATVEVIESMKT